MMEQNRESLWDRPELRAVCASFAESLAAVVASCEGVLALPGLDSADRAALELLQWHLGAAAGLLAGKPADPLSLTVCEFSGGIWPQIVAAIGSPLLASAYLIGSAVFTWRLGLSLTDLATEPVPCERKDIE